jgi:hypothetical protein
MENKKISQLVSAGTLTGSELVEVVKNGGNYKTTAQSIANLASGSSYTVYAANITQTTTSPPVATVLENTTGETFTFLYQNIGTYFLTKSGSDFDIEKTQVFMGTTASTLTAVNFYLQDTGLYIYTSTTDTGTYLDTQLAHCSLEIRIYN